jgi:hypothetical protein
MGKVPGEDAPFIVVATPHVIYFWQEIMCPAGRHADKRGTHASATLSPLSRRETTDEPPPPYRRVDRDRHCRRRRLRTFDTAGRRSIVTDRMEQSDDYYASLRDAATARRARFVEDDKIGAVRQRTLPGEGRAAAGLPMNP